MRRVESEGDRSRAKRTDVPARPGFLWVAVALALAALMLWLAAWRIAGSWCWACG